MLKKFGSMGQSLRDVTKSYATKAAAKINELQTLPQEIPENWDERIDENGKPYYVDTVTGEWYRVRAKQHKRIDTNEKISILTAESKKEFDDQKDKMLDEDGSLSESYSDNDLPSDTPPDDTNTKGGTPNGNGHTNANTNEHETKRTRAKSNHSKRSSTSVSQGWQCGQCTLENVGNAQTCNACLAPRPERPDEDEDELAINSGIQAMEERVTQGSTDDDLLSVEDRQHQQQSTMDAINSAMTESLDALGGDEIKGLTEEQRTQLLMFMDCVETEPEPSIKYLRGSNWDLEHAIETYFQQHPDHPKSRGGSLQFDLSQLHDIYAEDMDFEADVQLPDDIVHKTKAAASGRRDSTELDELPNGDGHGARESDNEDHDSDSDKQISYEPMQASGMYDDASAYGSHRRMNTDQQMAVAEQLSVQQSDFDVQLVKYRKEVDTLKAELKEQYEENDRLKVENEELQIEKDRYAIQSREIQNDWDRMSGYMGQILGEVAFIEECRKKGEDISTPTPKLNNIFQAIQHTISRNNNEEMNEEEEDEMMNMMDNTQQMNEVSDIYEKVWIRCNEYQDRRGEYAMASQVKVLHMRSSSFEHAYSHTIHPVEESNEAVQPYDDASQIDLEKEDTIFDPGGQDHYDEGDGTNIQTKPGYSLTICAREIVSDKGEKIVYIGDDIENERKNVVTWCDIERNDELSYGAERLRGEEVTFGVFYPNEIKIETVKVVREENKYDATTKQSDEDDEPELLSYVNASKYHQIKANNVVTVRKSILRELGKFMFGCSGDIVSLLPSGIMVILSKVPFQIQMPSRETDNNMLVVLSQIISDMASYRVEDMDVSMTRSLLAIPRTNRSCLLRKECILTGIAVLMNSHTYANRAQLIGNDGELEIVSEMTHLHYPQHVAHLALRMITAMCGASVAYYLVKQSKLCRVLIRHDIMIE
eukprot:1005112_1